MVNTRTLDNQFRPDVAADADGDFVITWQSNQQEAPGSSYGVFARAVQLGGRGAGRRVPGQYLHRRAAGQARESRHAPTATSWWRGTAQPGKSGLRAGSRGHLRAALHLRRCAAGGRVPGQHLHRRSISATRGSPPTTDGDFVVTWESQHQDGNYEGVFARRVAGNGAFGPEFQANTYTVDGQGVPVVDFDSDGDFVIAWYTEENQDGNSYGVFAQRFTLPPLADPRHRRQRRWSTRSPTVSSTCATASAFTGRRSPPERPP